MLIGHASNIPRTIDDLVGPDLLAKLDRLDVLSKKVFAGKLPGERRSKRRGQSVEFDDFRPYVPGDDLRHIDWNIFARLDRFILKLFLEDEDLSLRIVIDASASMDAGDPTKLVCAHRLAMALGYIGLVNQNRVSVAIFGAPGQPGLQRLTPIRGRRNTQRLGKFLLDSLAQRERASADAAPAIAFNDAIRRVASDRSGGRGVLVLLSDLLVREGITKGLNYLGAAGKGIGGGFDVCCLQILAPGELDPALEINQGLIGDLRLTDAETGRGSEVTISAATIKRYRRRLDRFIEDIQRDCSARGMTHMLIPSDANLADLLLGQLRTRGILA